MKHPRLLALGAATVAAAALATTATAGGIPHSTGGQALPTPFHIGRNHDAEPGAAVDGGGTLWIAGDVNPNETADPRASVGALTGADAWRSSDGGRTFHYAGSPFSTLQASEPGLAGEDTDMAAAPAKDSTGHYRAYAASLWIGATNLATTTDDGESWTVNPLGGIPAQDRPWIAASGPCTVYVLYHQLPSFTPFVNSYDACTVTNTGGGAVLPAVTSAPAILDQVSGNTFNKLVVDNSPTSPHRGAIYVPLQVCDTGGQPVTVVTDTAGTCGAAKVVVSVSTDGGRTFTESTVAGSPSLGSPVWGSTVAVDAAGTVYTTWTDKSAVWFATSHDAGASWSAPVRLTAPHRTGVYPTVAAGSNGQVDVAWYGANAFSTNGSDDPKVMGKPGVADSVPWYVYLSESRNGGRTWRTDRMTGAIHRGVVCTGGSSCAGNGDRNLYDDFGMVLSPRTNLATIAYSADLPGGLSTDTFTGWVSERCRLGDARCAAHG